ncbi:hypothetical protein C9374_001997 [Naegleria lovaniensis]|uniref:Anaphase-promoting complex subunit 2 n=1 Tax=Naegleria lovaniensis TaxID=51637 RepID=A0AA88GQF4_NAELO|nr:uncharacterized protein C9374_001997 [Naegleria lovaniensis]KAG2386962.1 hypothetical protein C9374_001997 [Naegleria lovaniensis]
MHQELVEELNKRGLNENWNPKPIHPSSSKSKLEKPDIIKIFIDMYKGNREIFVNEYRTILAETLLKNETYETNNEAKMVELLKIRFGEKNMQNCEIMLKDISDSKFLNSGIQGRLANRIDYIELSNENLAEITIQPDSQIPSVFMLSKNYWPQQLFNQHSSLQVPQSDENNTTIHLHPFVEQLMEEYASQYNAIKAPRKLLWEKQLGSIDFDIEIGGEVVSFVDIHPISASILFHFSDRNEWSMREMCELMNVDEKQFQKRISTWTKRGIIVENGDSLKLVDSLSSLNTQVEDDNMDESSAVQNPEEAMRVYQDLIIGMLNNFDSMPLSKIHNMLGMFPLDPLPPFDKSLTELGAFLGILVKEGVLECDSGEYRVKN